MEVLRKYWPQITFIAILIFQAGLLYGENRVQKAWNARVDANVVDILERLHKAEEEVAELIWGEKYKDCEAVYGHAKCWYETPWISDE